MGTSMAAPSFVAAALGEPAPSHVRVSGRTLYVARREDADPGQVLCGLAETNGSEYSVKVCSRSGYCAWAPVWDIGPWNIYDDYWDANRAEYGDLDQGTPEAQAAYDDGYNNGYDDQGGMPSNPAGIDLADGTFYDVGLNDNGYVTVTYLWT